jgi:hypothetical protein
MARITKAQRELAEALKFRATAKTLLYDRYNDWKDWEYDWLTDEVRRRPDYIYSEKEHAVLNRLQHDARAFTEYAGYTVPELTAVVYAGRFDFDEYEQELVEKIHRWGATTLKRRQICCLAGLARQFENIDYDPLLDREEPGEDRLSSAA